MKSVDKKNINWKKEELIAIDNASMRIQDARGERELAYEQGIEKGIAMVKMGVVVEMHKKSFSIEVISKVTKLPLDKVRQIIGEYEQNKK